jgi:hypothetical protein
MDVSERAKPTCSCAVTRWLSWCTDRHYLHGATRTRTANRRSASVITLNWRPSDVVT